MPSPFRVSIRGQSPQRLAVAHGPMSPSASLWSETSMRFPINTCFISIRTTPHEAYRDSKRDFSAGPAGAQPPETPEEPPAGLARGTRDGAGRRLHPAPPPDHVGGLIFTPEG